MNRKKLRAWIPAAVAVLLATPAPFLDLHAADGRAGDRASIESVVARLSAAWRAGDGQAWAAEFTQDADFTVWFGLHLKGSEQIGLGHQAIFDGMYAGTTFELRIRELRFLGDNAAVAQLAGFLGGPGREPGTEPDAVPMAVLQEIAGQWKIVAFQNTPYAVDEFRANGDLQRFKKLAAEQRAGRPKAPVLQ